MATSLIKTLTQEFISALKTFVPSESVFSDKDATSATFHASAELPGMLYDSVVVSFLNPNDRVVMVPENNLVSVPDAAKLYEYGSDDFRALFSQMAEGFAEMTGLRAKPEAILAKMPSLNA